VEKANVVVRKANNASGTEMSSRKGEKRVHSRLGILRNDYLAANSRNFSYHIKPLPAKSDDM